MQTQKQIDTRTCHNIAQHTAAFEKAKVALDFYRSGLSLGASLKEANTHYSTFWKYIKQNKIKFELRKQTHSPETCQKHRDYMNKRYTDPTERQKQSERMMGHKAWNKGLHKETDSRVLKISEKLKGNLTLITFNWKGDEARYSAKHNHIRKKFGKAQKCEANTTHINRFYHWANLDHLYSRDVSDYIQLCVSCHYQYDHNLIPILGKKISDRTNNYITREEHNKHLSVSHMFPNLSRQTGKVKK